MGASAMIVPTIFSVIDKLSTPVKGMIKHIDSFGHHADAAISKAERLTRKLTPALSGAAKEFLSFASTAAIAAAIVSGAHFSVQSLKDYETSVASFRTIVSDLSDKDFARFKTEIASVAKETKKSSIDVATAFENIAGLNADLAKTPEQLGAVTKAAITLSKASRDDLGTSASNLVGIMNQFSLGAMESDRVINVLAAGQAAGASSITQTADAFTVFGAVAAKANLSLEQSTALTEVLAAKQIKGSEAGTALRGALLKLQEAGVGYASGMFNTGDALRDVKAKMDSLKTAKEKDAYLTKTFGVINLTAGSILLDNIKTYEDFTTKVTGSTEAQKAAAINTDTLSTKLEELSSSYVNVITGADGTSKAMDRAKAVAGFLADNMETIVSVGMDVLLFFAGWKALLFGSKVAMAAYNIVYGINNALQKRSIFYTEGNTYAKTADLVVTKAMTAAQWLFNTSLYGCPIIWIIASIVALIAVVVAIIKYWNEWGAAATAFFAIFLPGLGLIISLIQAFRNNWDNITKAFKEGGVLAGFKAIGATILDVVLMPLQQVLEVIAKITGADWAANAAKGIKDFRDNIGINVASEDPNQQAVKEAVNPTAAKNEALAQSVTNTNNAKVDLNIKDPNGRVEARSNSNMVQIKTTSTLGGWGY